MQRLKEVLKEVIRCVITGILVGIVVGFFQLCCNYYFNLALEMYVKKEIIIMIILAIILFVFSQLMIKTNPTIAGSGIPQIEMTVNNKYKMNFLSLPFMFLNSLISIFFGLSLGSEGPSVTLGGCSAIYVNKLFKDENKENIAIAGGAGFACAFLNPLAGMIYVIEEQLHQISIKVILKIILTIIPAYYVTKLINHHKIIEIETVNYFSLKNYLLLFVLIIFVPVLSHLFVNGIIKLKDFLFGKKIFKYRLIIVFFFTIIIGLYCPILLGSGSQIINNLLEYKSVSILILLLLFRLVFTFVCANSNTSGGLLIPMLTVGAILGGLISLLFNSFSSGIETNLILISMVSVYACVTKSPLTALTLALTIGNPLVMFLPVIITIVFSYVIYNLTKGKDIYEELSKRIKSNIL